jgi:hypothetical protein
MSDTACDVGRNGHMRGPSPTGSDEKQTLEMRQATRSVAKRSKHRATCNTAACIPRRAARHAPEARGQRREGVVCADELDRVLEERLAHLPGGPSANPNRAHGISAGAERGETPTKPNGHATSKLHCTSARRSEGATPEYSPNRPALLLSTHRIDLHEELVLCVRVQAQSAQPDL